MAIQFTQTKDLPFSAKQMFDLVADVASYPEFLPWCLASRVHQENESLLIADLIIGYRAFRDKYTSRVTLDPPSRISVMLEEGPLSFLKNDWTFTQLEEGHCKVHLDLSFQLDSKIKQALMSSFFDEAAQKMIQSFEERAKKIYG